MSIFLKGKKVSGLVGWARLVATENTAKLKKNGIDCTNVEDSLYALKEETNAINSNLEELVSKKAKMYQISKATGSSAILEIKLKAVTSIATKGCITIDCSLNNFPCRGCV